MTTPVRYAHHRYSYEEYLAYERDAGMKHEYDGGEIFAMAGGSLRHNALASRVSAALEIARRPACVAFQSDQRVRALATGRATYPDASMVCEPIERDPADKWLGYQLIPSLEEYVLVSQAERRVERYRRLATGTWEYTEATAGTVQLRTGATLDLDRLYNDLPE